MIKITWTFDNGFPEAEAEIKFNTPSNFDVLVIFLKSDGLNPDTTFDKSDVFEDNKLCKLLLANRCLA